MPGAPLHKSGLRILLAGILLTLSSCRANGPAPGSLDDLAHQYVSLAVELGEHDLDSLDFNSGQKSPLPKHSLAGYATLHDRAVHLYQQIGKIRASTADDASRKTLLLGQVDAIALRIEQLTGNNRSFDDESKVFFGVAAPADTDVELRKKLRAQVSALLGTAGDPARAYSQFDSKFIVPPDRVAGVMKAALDQCRAVTLSHMALPAGEHVEVQYVRLKPWNAFSRYLGDAHSIIQVNMDYPLTVDRILTLACHEGYPGHHVFNSTRDQALVGGRHREEFTVQPTFSPQSYVSEAAASYAPLLALPDVERLRIERDMLAPLAGLEELDWERYLALEKLIDALHTAEPAIARNYLDGRLEFVRAADVLSSETLMEHPEPMLLYLNEFRTYMLAYTVGSDSMQRFIEAGHASPTERWQRYIGLMTAPVVSIPATQD